MRYLVAVLQAARQQATGSWQLAADNPLSPSPSRTLQLAALSSQCRPNNHSSNHIVIIISNFAQSLPNNGEKCAGGNGSCHSYLLLLILLIWPSKTVATTSPRATCRLGDSDCVARANRLIILSRVGQKHQKHQTQKRDLAARHLLTKVQTAMTMKMGCHGPKMDWARLGWAPGCLVARLLNFSICHKGLAMIYIYVSTSRTAATSNARTDAVNKKN